MTIYYFFFFFKEIGSFPIHLNLQNEPETIRFDSYKGRKRHVSSGQATKKAWVAALVASRKRWGSSIKHARKTRSSTLSKCPNFSLSVKSESRRSFSEAVVCLSFWQIQTKHSASILYRFFFRTCIESLHCVSFLSFGKRNLCFWFFFLDLVFLFAILALSGLLFS